MSNQHNQICNSDDFFILIKVTQSWDPTYDDKLKALRRLKLSPATLDRESTNTGNTKSPVTSPSTDEPPEVLVVRDDDTDPLSKFRRRFRRPGQFLMQKDLRFCLENTNFTEEQVLCMGEREDVNHVNE